jgi:hypothetical protein
MYALNVTDDTNWKWVIDLLGASDVQRAIIDYWSKYKTAKDFGIVHHPHGPPYCGLYFKEGHWVCYWNGFKTDSMGDQKTQQTSHLCQSFAMYNYLYLSGCGKLLPGELEAKDYVANSKKIGQMLLGFFAAYEEEPWLANQVDLAIKSYNGRVYKHLRVDPKNPVAALMGIIERIAKEGLA